MHNALKMILICLSKRGKGTTGGRWLLFPLCYAKWLWDSLQFTIRAPLFTTASYSSCTVEGNWSFPKIRMTPLSSCWWNVELESLGMVTGYALRLGFYSAWSTLGNTGHTGTDTCHLVLREEYLTATGKVLRRASYEKERHIFLLLGFIHMSLYPSWSSAALWKPWL